MCHFRLVFAGLKHLATNKRTLNINPEMGLLISIQLEGWNHPSPAILKSINLRNPISEVKKGTVDQVTSLFALVNKTN